MRILVTGVNGMTGHAVIRQLVARGADVTGLVSRDDSRVAIERLGATPVVGDLRDSTALKRAMAAAERVYHICPAWVPDELEIGEAVIDAARASDISLFGYHSVIAPHVEEIPSHWAKMQVQMALMRAELPFSIVQPAAYMQNLAVALDGARDNGRLEVPYRVDAPLTWVDAEDVGEAIAILMTRPEQRGGTYELCGTAAPMTSLEVAAAIGRALGRDVEAVACSLEEHARKLLGGNLSSEQMDRFKSYIRFVDQFGMRAGGPKVLTEILGRPPAPFETFIERHFRSAENTVS